MGKNLLHFIKLSSFDNSISFVLDVMVFRHVDMLAKKGHKILILCSAQITLSFWMFLSRKLCHINLQSLLPLTPKIYLFLIINTFHCNV